MKARPLSASDIELIVSRGEIFGMPYAASVMRHLVRRGYFMRVERKGFQTRWQLTEKGERVRKDAA